MLPIHEPFFVMPDGTRAPFFKLRTTVHRAVIVQDPYFAFDSEHPAVCWEEYRLESGNPHFISDFIGSCEANSGLTEDEVLWHGSGYWSVKTGVNLYIGSGVEAMKSTLSQLRSGRLVFLLDNSDFCVLIKGDIVGGFSKVVEIDAYASAHYRPWVEILEPFRRAVSEIEEGRFTKKVCTEPPIVSHEFRTYGDSEMVFPYAISPTKQGWIGPSIIRNQFGSFGLSFLFTQARGGWLKEDFFRAGRSFCFSGTQHRFGDVVVIQGLIQPSHRRTRGSRALPQVLSTYQRFVDSFEA